MSSDTVLNAGLENARRELLDLTTRNRLLSTSRRDARSSRLEVVDQLSKGVFRHLVADKKAMSFFPGDVEVPADVADDRQGLLLQPGDEELLGEAPATRHADVKLQTRLTADRLRRKLLKLYYDAQTYREEQGVNVLYLALGFLRWYEDQNSQVERFAHLLLVPVSLERQSVRSGFKIRCTDDDITTNLSLQERLKRDFGITLSSQPYVGASFRIEVAQDIPDVPTYELAKVIARIIQVGGPIHCGEIARRVTQLWGMQRTEKRIREAVDHALTVASRQAGAKHDGEFYWLDEQQEVTVRDRSAVESSTLRQPQMLPPAEIRRALTAIVEVHLGAARDEVIVEAARLFGFRATSPQLREVIEREVDWLIEPQGLDERNGMLYVTKTLRLRA